MSVLSSDVSSSDLSRHFTNASGLSSFQIHPRAIVISITLGGGGPLVRVDSPYRHSGFAFSSERIHRASQQRQLIPYFQRTIKPIKSRNTTLTPYNNPMAYLCITLCLPTCDASK